ncbi:MAG: hypothetical protein JRG69_09235 [Deltaproteobacteria bacterium]|nr:hypothetical protein [Deltaproteobacteria bacterium]
MKIRDFFKSKPSIHVLDDKEIDVALEATDESQDVAGSPKPSKKQKASEALKGPIGLDIGTANIVVAQNRGKDIRALRQLNAFFTIPYSNITKRTLLRDEVIFFEKDKKLYVLGYSAEGFANTFGGSTRKPIESGLLNPKENESISVIRAIISQFIQEPQKKDEKICFSVPGEPIDRPASVVFHESIIRMHLKSLGYSPIPINEGLAVILSELSSNNFTGIGISIGGGMCNVCFAYLSVPVITYSIQKGGDYIDSMVGSSIGESPTKVKEIKEEGLDLTVEPKDRVEIGLHVFYDDLFSSLVKSLQQVLGSSDNIPRLSMAVPIVLSGGTVIPRGSREKFEKALSDIRLPIRVSEIIIAQKPLYSTAKGALTMAMTEEKEI